MVTLETKTRLTYGRRYRNTPPIEIVSLSKREERLGMHLQLNASLTNSGTLSMRDFIELCGSIGNPPSLPLSKERRNELFSSFGIQALSHILPTVRPVHVTVDPMTHSIAMHDQIEYTGLPAEIAGVPLEKILSPIASPIPNKTGKDGQQQRIAAASGACYRTSQNGLLALAQEHPHLLSHMQLQRIEPANRLAVAADGTSYPGVVRLALGHSIASVGFMNGDESMALLIDPTIAQVDLTNAYDIEITSVPQKDVADYMRLRYSSTPYATVTQRKP